MGTSEQIKNFKGLLDAIDIYFELTEEKIDKEIKRGKDGNRLFCQIIQNTVWRKRIIYYLENRVDINVTVLEITFPITLQTPMTQKIVSCLQYNGKVSFEQTKSTITYRMIYKTEEISSLANLGLLMIEIAKSKRM